MVGRVWCQDSERKTTSCAVVDAQPSATGVSVLTYFKGQPNLKRLQLHDHLSQGTAMKNSLMNPAEGAFVCVCAF